jgi:hypothetical protein
MFIQVLVLVAILSVVYARTPAEETILTEVSKYKSQLGIDTLCTKNTCCTVSATESCSISKMTKDKSTLVLPGGETRCIFSDSTPFAFQVNS